MPDFKVRASSMTATYNAGTFAADSPEDACEQARQSYANSPLGRALGDARAFRFYTVDRFPHEEQADA